MMSVLPGFVFNADPMIKQIGSRWPSAFSSTPSWCG
jgi:hypothetical protein